MLYDNCLLVEPSGSNVSIFSFYKEAWSFEISKMIAVVRRQIEYYFLSFLHLRLKFQIIVIDISTPVTNLLKGNDCYVRFSNLEWDFLKI